MEASRRAPDYDRFKFIIAVILLILFLFLLWRAAGQSSQPLPTGLPPTGTQASPPSATPEANPVAVRASATSSPASSTSVPLPSPTTSIDASATGSPPAPTAPSLPTATDPALPTDTPIATPTEPPAIEPTPIPVGEPASTVTACDSASSRSRLQSGMSATILRRLNFRSSPGIRNNWLLTNIPGTRVEVLGGPECVPHLAGAYVWWQIRLPDGEIGWSAEGSIHGTFYFMEPVR